MMVRIVTPNGYDYVKESMLMHFVRIGYCLGLAETREETRKRLQKEKVIWIERFLKGGENATV